MNKLKNYIVFHLNLAYSSIEEEQREFVIKRCYWPVLHLAKKYSIQLGIELSGYTLELIKKIDPNWIVEFKNLLNKGLCELIGSGYSQIIGPLVPALVNNWNQRIGLNVYNDVLNIKPKIALVNEMAYSAGIVEHYIANGYQAIIMEWNNPRKYHPEWKNEWRYFPQIAKGSNKYKIPLIWADSIAFQKFQRVVHGDIEQDEYIEYLKSHLCNTNRYFPLYANDVEIFDFRPERFKTEAKLIEKSSEWKKIYNLFSILKKDRTFDFILPSKVLDGLELRDAGNLISLESPEQPIPVKKQEKYNINRWALTGRNDYNLNTKCFTLYKYFQEEKIDSLKEWKDLCYLWSSDFRTHITGSRWKKFTRRLHSLSKKYQNSYVPKPENIQKVKKLSIPFRSQGMIGTRKGRFLQFQNDKYLVELNARKGLTIHKFIYTDLCPHPLIGTIEHGYYNDISLGADFFSGHTIIEQLGKHKITDLNSIDKPEGYLNGNNVSVSSSFKTANIRFHFNIIFYPQKIILKKHIFLPERKMQIIHPFNFTFFPESWDQKSLYFASHNGGSSLEIFKLGEKEFDHGDIVSSLISAKHGIGATVGLVRIGDKNKAIDFYHDTSLSAMIPSIVFRKAEGGKYFFRLEYSIQEIDETFRTSKKNRILRSFIEIVPLLE